MAYLKIEELSVSHKNRVAISGLNLEANKGEIIGFVGADGAGKSSALNAIAGVIKFDAKITFDNVVYTNPKESQKLKPVMGYMPQGIGLVLYDTLSVAEHLDFFADIRDLKKDLAFEEYKKRLLSMSGLSAFLDRQAGDLSGGMMQKLSLICTMLHRPSLLILDEPTTGVDPLSRLELWDILKQNAKEYDMVALISTAYMQEAQKMDRVLLFDEGKVISEVNDKSVSLENLFFENAKKNNKLLPTINISPAKNALKKNEVVMNAKKITKKFGAFIANEKVDIQLKSSEILGLLGANGAGKTTFIKMLLGLLKIDEGELYLLNKKISSADDRKELKSKIGYVSQHFALYDDMSVRENMLFFASMHKIDAKKSVELINKYSMELGFNDYLDKMPKDLPIGINQRFSLATAILHEPIILFLDEPTSGVDVIARAQFWKLLKELKEKMGMAILITTHYMSEAEFCDRVVLLKDGKKVADDSVENLYERFANAKNFEEIFLEFYK